MRKDIAVLLLIISVFRANAQVYFDSIYDNGLMTERTSNVLPRLNSGYEFFTTGIDFGLGGGSRLNRYLISEQGITDDFYTIFHDSSRFEIGTMVRTHEGATVCFYSRSDYYSNYNFELKKYSDAGVPLWTRIYGDSIQTHAPFEIVETQDHGFIFIGQRYSQTDGDMIVYRVDSVGAVQWARTYGGAQYDSGNSLLQTPDSGFLLLGWTRSYGAGQRDFYLVKTDSLGNQQWQQTYGDANNQSGSCIIATSDGNYVMCGGAGNGAARMIKINPSGTVIWQYDYSHPDGTGSNYLFKVIELEDGSLIATGLSNNSAESDAGWLLKTDADGAEMWQQRYNRSTSADLFYSVLDTEDGGFLLSGQARNLETNSQDAWLLKVDSVGCPYPNCIVAVDAPLPTQEIIWAWPNPASEVVNVQWHTGKNALVAFTDMLGRSYSPPAQEVQGVVGPYMRYDVSAFENGIYGLTIIQGEMRTTMKVVVEH